MSAKRETALTQLLPQLEISSLARPIDLRLVMDRSEIIIDFGSGMGDHAIELAASNPETGVLAIDVHTVGLCEVAGAATEHKLKNIRTHHGDGLDVLSGWLTPETISQVHIMFPDPWPKARHHKRRLIQPQVVSQIVQVLRPGGSICFTTDDPNYFDHAVGVFESDVNLTAVLGNWEPPLTTYHKRALRLGNPVNTVQYSKLGI
jgi:tRNA (guanine-N7-)-methyltransferase